MTSYANLKSDPVRYQAVLERNRARKASKRRFLTAVKETCGCVDCGTREGRLDFDHRPGTVKVFNLAHPSGSWARILAELDKCDVRCIRCHATRHAALVKGKPGQRQAACNKGHSLTDPANVYEYRGKRHCRTCRLERQREWRASRTAA